MKPKVFLETLQFNDGTNIELEENSLTIFVGANNVGKSAALKNIYNLNRSHSSQYTIHQVITTTKLNKIGAKEDFINYLENNFHKIENESNYNYLVNGGNYNSTAITREWEQNSSRVLGDIFFKYLSTEGRINYSNSVGSIDFNSQSPSHPIHKMYLDDELELEISNYFKQAFNTDLTVDRLSGSIIHLKIGERPVRGLNEDRLSRSYNEKIKVLPALSQQGDGMRSFVSIILEMISDNHSSLFIDEPEAFLHPPQARLLGKLIGKLFKDRQVYISSHSSDFIKGVLESNNQNTSIIRIYREGKLNIPTILNEEDIKEIWRDPILRYSSIIDGLFHDSVIICESDGDCRFFSTLLDAEYEKDIRYYRISDTLFIPSHGKSKISSIVKALRKISVPTYSICDFDIFNNVSPLKELVEAHGGDWGIIERPWKVLYSSISNIKSQLDKEEAKKGILEILDTENSTNLTIKNIDKIKEILKISTAWSFAKKSGLSFVPSGNPHAACKEVINYLNNIGIFPLIVGELESFDKSIGNGNKAKWLEEVLLKDFKNENVLKQAKEFLKNLVNNIFNN